MLRSFETCVGVAEFTLFHQQELDEPALLDLP